MEIQEKVFLLSHKKIYILLLFILDSVGGRLPSKRKSQCVGGEKK